MGNRFEGWDVTELRRQLRNRAGILHRDQRVKVRFDESDLVNNTWLRAAETEAFPEGLDTFEKQLAWLMTIQSRLMIDKYRHEHSSQKDVRREQNERALQQALLESSIVPGGNLPATGPGPDELAVRRELLSKTMETLTEPAQTILREKLEGYTFEEIATRLGLPLGKVTGIYYRALRKAKKQLGGAEDEEP